MPGYGGVYVEVDASAVNSGISMLSASGDIPGGEEGSVGIMAWLNWSYDDTGSGGYTGNGWFWDDNNNDLVLAWSTYSSTTTDNDTGLPYADNEIGFKKWLVDTQPGNLDMLLKDWNLTRKENFINNNMQVLGVYPADLGGCIELHQ